MSHEINPADDFEVEALSDEDLESVDGGAALGGNTSDCPTTMHCPTTMTCPAEA